MCHFYLAQATLQYLQSLPSKRFRDMASDALNVWLQVPEQALTEGRDIIKYLHSSSLM